MGLFNFEVNEAVVRDPQAALDKIMQDNQHLRYAVWIEDIERFNQYFSNEYGFELQWTPDAQKVLVEKVDKTGTTVRALCEHLFRNFHHGLKIVHKNTQQRVFNITEATLSDPEKELSAWIADSFRHIISPESGGA